jgi:hypothetical protein
MKLLAMDQQIRFKDQVGRQSKKELVIFTYFHQAFNHVITVHYLLRLVCCHGCTMLQDVHRAYSNCNTWWPHISCVKLLVLWAHWLYC